MKPVAGFPGYWVTNKGCVWSSPKNANNNRKGKRLIPRKAGISGHLQVILVKAKKPFPRYVHRLVLEAYIGPCPEGMECCHFDGDPTNNDVANLCWGSRKDNQHDRVRHGTDSRGEKQHNAKLTEDQVRLIFSSYHNGIHTQQELADYFGVDTSQISRIVNKKTWKHIWEALK